MHDLKYALRGMIRKPAFTLTAIVTLALGIGGNTAMFGFVDVFLLRSLPYTQPDQLMLIEETNLAQGIGGSNASYPNLTDWKARSQMFADIAGFAPTTLNLGGVEEPERLAGGMITPNYFSLLGIAPISGRSFTAEETRPGNDRVTLVSEGLWKRRFGADAGLVGRAIRLNAEAYTVVGIVPTDALRQRVDLWVPLATTATVQRRSNHFITTIGRLKPGFSTILAEAELNQIAETLALEYPETNKEWRVGLTPLQEEVVSDVRSGLLILMSVVGLVLLIACANFSSLLMARANNRVQEIAIRAALGSGRSRLVRQLLTESVTISVAGAFAGILFGAWAMALMRSNLLDAFPRMAEATLDLRVLAFTFVLALISGVVSGLVPALQSTAANFNQSLRSGGAVNSMRHTSRFQNTLTVVEISLSMILLVGAGLLITNFLRASRIDLGFNPENVLTFRVSIPTQKYPRGVASGAFFQQALERLQALPGVTVAGAISHAPLSGQNLSRGYIREGDAIPSRNDSLIASYAMITPGLISAMGMRLRDGRDFSSTDAMSGGPVAIINRSLADRLWPGASAVGRQIRVFTDEDFPRTVVGVVDDIKQRSMIRSAPHIFVPHSQDPITTMTIMLRTERDPQLVIGTARAIVKGMDNDIPAYDLLTMDQKIRAFSAPQRSATTMIALFAAVALLLAVTGIFGVISYFVSQRTREIGIRVALGARRADVIRMVVLRGMTLASIGVSLGTLGSFGLTRFLSSMLFGVSPTEPSVFAGVASTLLIVTMMACYVPARRASRVDPIKALKME